uniref:Uncharacterized protein n=1 Tax=viral metagenome TaxID=1070528 RepID=A0A6H1Z7K1_9ZZZZ
MKGGVTKRIEDTVKALEKGQLKNALGLTDRRGLERHHQIVEAAARTCLQNKGDKEVCKKAMSEARDKVQETITVPEDDTSLEGIEEILSEAPTETPQGEPAEITDDEVYENCEECHIAEAAIRFSEVCAAHPEDAGDSCRVIAEKVADENTEPADWIRTMVETAEGAKGEAKEKMVAAVTELTDYLERRDSPFLKEMDKEV